MKCKRRIFTPRRQISNCTFYVKIFSQKFAGKIRKLQHLPKEISECKVSLNTIIKGNTFERILLSNIVHRDFVECRTFKRTFHTSRDKIINSLFAMENPRFFICTMQYYVYKRYPTFCYSTSGPHGSRALFVQFLTSLTARAFSV